MKFEHLKVELPGLKLKNPIMPASGCFGFGKEFSDLYDINCLGAIVLKSITREPRYGNPLPRICETSSGMLNAIGLQNPGVDEFINVYIPWLEQLHTNIIANVAGSSIEDYIEVIEKLNVYDCIQAFELNISCPNVKKGGIAFGVEKEIAYEITKKCKEVAKKPLYVKLSPNVHNIVEIAKEVERAKADGLVLINTLLGMRFDLKTGKPILANQTGGLSGPAIMPIALRMVNQVANAVNIPIIGVGGISKSEDVLEFLLAGASAVQIGMHNFVDPYCCKKIIEELEVTIQKYGWKSVKEIIERN